MKPQTTLTESGQAGMYRLVHLINTAHKVRSLHDEHLTQADREVLDEIHESAANVLGRITFDGEFNGVTFRKEDSNLTLFLVDTPVELSKNASLLWRQVSCLNDEQPVVVRFGFIAKRRK